MLLNIWGALSCMHTLTGYDHTNLTSECATQQTNQKGLQVKQEKSFQHLAYSNIMATGHSKMASRLQTQDTPVLPALPSMPIKPSHLQGPSILYAQITLKLQA